MTGTSGKGWQKPSPKAKQRGVGIGVLALGTLATLVLMSNQGQLPHGPLWGMLAMLVAAVGLVWALGLFHRDSADAVPIEKTVLGRVGNEPIFLEPRYTVTLAVSILIAGGILLGYPALPWVVGAALLALLPSAISRPGLLVFVIVSGLYLPFLGAYGLWDPWETHYGEVSREILSRDDWISLWWAQENWFWSKPILIFWSEALSMGALGVDPSPDANPAHPEWALRLPIYLMSIGAVLAVYAAIGRVFGKRAGVLSALVLATMPHFFFLSHQAITDMPFVANMVIAMSLLILALREEPDRRVTDFRVGRWVISGQHVLVAAIFLIVAPQALYLVSRNVTMVRPFQFAWHGDEFLMGSAGNAGVPGNAALHDMAPWANSLVAQPMVQGIVWAVGLGLLLWFVARERRVQSLYMFAFYVFCGLAFMGKGIPGFGLPGMVALLYLVASRRWSLLLEGRLRVAAGALTVAVVGLPWYVAMYIRHGPAFTDRLLVHDHINRLAAGVHGDTGSIEYFLEQIGYAMFPWVALVPAALTMWLWYGRRSGVDPALEYSETQRHRIETAVLIAVWFAGAFTLFNAMITKFHHYIFPAVPPAAIATGILIDRAFGDDPAGPRWKRIAGTVLAGVAPVFVALGIGGAWGNLRGVIPEDVPQPERADWVLDHGMGTAGALALVLLGIAVGAGAWWLIRSCGEERRAEPGPWEPSLAAAMIAGTVLGAFVARDLSWVTDARPQGYERLIQLFIYNYGRPWPDHFDYRPILTGFGVVAVLLLALGAFRFLRPVASRALVGIAIAFTAWALDVYMIDLSPHWGQRELLKAYYEEREGPEEPVVAWQMNWKGENFYTGNRVAVFVDLDNQKIREWIGENRGKRAFFLMEHSRLNNFKSLVPGREVREVTDMRLNNKFLLVEVTL